MTDKRGLLLTNIHFMNALGTEWPVYACYMFQSEQTYHIISTSHIHTIEMNRNCAAFVTRVTAAWVLFRVNETVACAVRRNFNCLKIQYLRTNRMNEFYCFVFKQSYDMRSLYIFYFLRWRLKYLTAGVNIDIYIYFCSARCLHKRENRNRRDFLCLESVCEFVAEKILTFPQFVKVMD